MVDYTKVTGKTGLMMMRDTGWTIEFWFKAGYDNDHWQGMSFNWTANGTTTPKDINYPMGANWAKVGSANVGSSQTVTFRLLESTGTQGMGGPTTFNQWIDRSRAPDPPAIIGIHNITSNSVVLQIQDGWDGGAGLDFRQVAYGLDPNNAWHYSDSVPNWVEIGGLTPGDLWYFWARTHNAKGWSNWSGRVQALTLRVPDAPTIPSLSNVTSTTVTVSFTPNWNGGATVLEYQIGWDTTPDATSLQTVSANSPYTVTDLIPGTVYYFWVRARNSVGWGNWTSPNNVRTIAGARIKVDSVWKIAVPYVKVGGVWKRAEPWVRSAGAWKRTI